MPFTPYSFKAVQQVVAMLNVGHFGGTGAFSIAFMIVLGTARCGSQSVNFVKLLDLACTCFLALYSVLQNVAAFGPCIYCYMYLSLRDFIFRIPILFSPLISQ